MRKTFLVLVTLLAIGSIAAWADDGLRRIAYSYLQASQGITTGPTLDNSSVLVSVTTGTSTALNYTASGLLLIDDVSNGDACIYLIGGGSSLLIGTTLSTCVGATTGPGAGKQSVAYNGSAYAIYNNVGSTQQYSGVMLRGRVGN